MKQKTSKVKASEPDLIVYPSKAQKLETQDFLKAIKKLNKTATKNHYARYLTNKYSDPSKRPTPLKHLLKNVDKKELYQIFAFQLGNNHIMLRKFKRVYNQLLKMRPVKCSIELNMRYILDKYTGKLTMDVYGIDKYSRKSGELAIEFTSWNKWLTMTISPNTLKTLDETFIIYHAINEMTFISFDPKVTRTEFKKIKVLAKQAIKKPKKLYSVTELLKKNKKKNAIRSTK